MSELSDVSFVTQQHVHNIYYGNNDISYIIWQFIFTNTAHNTILTIRWEIDLTVSKTNVSLHVPLNTSHLQSTFP